MSSIISSLGSPAVTARATESSSRPGVSFSIRSARSAAPKSRSSRTQAIRPGSPRTAAVRSTSNPWLAASRATAAASDVLPDPADPVMARMPPWPSAAAASSRSASAISRRRPSRAISQVYRHPAAWPTGVIERFVRLRCTPPGGDLEAIMKTQSLPSHPAPASHDALRIAVPPGAVLVDDPRGVVISGCEPGSPVLVRACVEIDLTTRQAEGTYCASQDGTVDTGRDASVAGTYVGSDPFGLWWSGEVVAPSDKGIPAPLSATLTVDAAGRTAKASIRRCWLAAGTTVTKVREAGVLGLFACPAGPGPFPAAIAFAGSSGGLGAAAAWAPVLASHGIAALAIAYFGAPGLPDALVRIDVEVVGRAAEWLLRRPDIADRTIAVLGMSRGSELALLSGALLETVGAVVAFAPSGVCWAGLGPRGPVGSPAWRFGGEDIPCAGVVPGGVTIPAAAPGSAIALRPYYDAFLADQAMIRAAEIPVEQVNGPI